MKCETYHIKPTTYATIAPHFGCNIISWVVEGREILYFPKFSNKQEIPFYAGGNPVLFPAVGRTWDRSKSKAVANKYSVYGCVGTFEMPMHGFGLMGSWKKQNQKVTKTHIDVEYKLSISKKVQATNYPFEVSLLLNYLISARSITITAIVENHDEKPAPFAFGFHPYFKITQKENIKIKLPCTKRILLHPELFIPVGLEQLRQPEFPLEDKRYIEAYAGCKGKCASIIDTNEGWSLNIKGSEMIENYVISAKPKEPYICVEPWTKGLGGYEMLAENDWQQGKHINVIKPQQKQTVAVTYSLKQD